MKNDLKPTTILDTPCIEWTKARSKSTGYGIASIKKENKWKSINAHRLEWEIHNGPIPKGLIIMHKCDNPPCYNIDHLKIGTQSENIKEMYQKKRNNYTGNSLTHGTISMYYKNKCRCVPCKEANRIYRLNWRHKNPKKALTIDRKNKQKNRDRINENQKKRRNLQKLNKTL